MRINHFYIKFADCHLFTGLEQGVLYFSYPNIKELPYRKWLSNIRYSREGKGKPILELEHKWFMYVRLCWIALWWKPENSAAKKILCSKWQDLHKMNCEFLGWRDTWKKKHTEQVLSVLWQCLCSLPIVFLTETSLWALCVVGICSVCDVWYIHTYI